MKPTTPDTSLPPLVIVGPRRKMILQIEVSADFEHRLDNQWEVEREIEADRWSWKWLDECATATAELRIKELEGKLSTTEAEVERLLRRPTEVEQKLRESEAACAVMRESSANLNNEVKVMVKGLLGSRVIVCSESNPLLWEGVSPVDLEPSEQDKILAQAWTKLTNRVELSLSTDAGKSLLAELDALKLQIKELTTNRHAE